MTLALLLLPVLLGLICLGRRRRRGAAICLTVALAAFALVGCGVVPTVLLARLQAGFVDQYSDWGARNVIVMLGAGTRRAANGQAVPGVFANSRMLRATMLYHACRGSGTDCKIEVSGGDAQGTGTAEAALYGAWLVALGVPAGDILREPASMNTWQNAAFSAPLLHNDHADRVLLVSSASHLRRARLYFAHFGIKTVPIRADLLVPGINWLPQAWNLALTDLALHEYLGIARYHLYQAMGWNAAVSKAGAL